MVCGLSLPAASVPVAALLCALHQGPRGILQPLASGSLYFHPTVILSRQGQLSGKLTSSKSCSCRTSQHRWLPQKMKTYFLAFKVWNRDGKISANHRSCRGTKIYPKGAGSHRNYCTLCVVSSHPRGKESAVQKALSGRTNSSCQWLTRIGWGSLNWRKLLGNSRGAPGNGDTDQESLGGKHLHSLNETWPKCVQNNEHLKHLFHGEFRNFSGYFFLIWNQVFFHSSKVSY